MHGGNNSTAAESEQRAVVHLYTWTPMDRDAPTAVVDDSALPWSPDIGESLRADALSWCRHWQDERLAHECMVRWSGRMVRSLGRAYSRRGLIRLNGGLAQSDCEVLLREVLCHELAHVAVHRRFGDRAQPHGAPWRHCMQLVGFEPRVTIPVECLPPTLRDLIDARQRSVRRKRRRKRARHFMTESIWFRMRSACWF
ncbi:MAG: SprT family zinc-dependent metalloprotease [Phycisphaerae bacterium]|nr:SprT family zinc-dependent metalloprotease [Phycisphaerae bacterium]